MIAIKANARRSLDLHVLDPDIVEFAGLAHDLGHPPFGHNGEQALHKCMQGYGGFEGNAQTLRVLAVLEKKRTADGQPQTIDRRGNDNRRGLNLTYRTLASILKYDRELAPRQKSFDKGYYASERALVAAIKKHVAGHPLPARGRFKSVECQIMDIADDIAYSTYDLEDSFKAGFLNPLDVFVHLGSAPFRNQLVNDVESAVRKLPEGKGFRLSEVDLYEELEAVFEGLFDAGHKTTRKAQHRLAVLAATRSANLAKNGYIRTEFTSELVNQFIEGIRFQVNPRCPPLSRAYLDLRALKRVEILKRFTFLAMIMSPRLQIVNFRGQEIVSTIFSTLLSEEGFRLLPEDAQETYQKLKSAPLARRRVISDFVAGMSDRYAVEFYERIKSAMGFTIFKPH